MKSVWKYTAALLALLLTSALFLPAMAADVKGKEEVIYAMTDASGKVRDAYVVNIFGGGSVTDYGSYSHVRMMTTTDKLQQDGDKITFSSSADRVYYEGTLDKVELPWTVSVTYTLDGKEIAPAELGGKSGALQIHLSVTENKACGGSFFDDYALQITAVLDTERCTGITAEDATMANVGSDKQMTYTVLPGKGLDTVISADVTDFSMKSISINGIKLNLHIEVDDIALMDKVTELMDGAKRLNNGAGEVYDGTKALDGSTGALKDGVTALQSGIGDLNSGIDTLSKGVTTVQNGLYTLNGKSAQLKNGSAQVLSALKTIEAGLGGVSLSTAELQQLLTASGAIKDGIRQLCDGIGALKQNLGYAQFKGIMAKNGVDLDTLKAGNAQVIASLTAQIESLQATLSQIQNVPGYEEQAAQLLAQITGFQTTIRLLTGSTAVISGTEQYLGTMAAAVNELNAGAARLQTSYDAFDASIAQLVTTLRNLTGKLGELASGIGQLVSQYDTLDKGIGDYTYGVAQIVSGYTQIVNGVKSLSDGGKALLDGTAALQDGTKALTDGIGQLNDGAKKLHDGTEELYEKTAHMDSQVQDQIDGILASIQGVDSETVSFVSEKNENVEAVQFVIKTDGIEKPAAPAKDAQQKETLTLWQKLLRLFKLY